VAGTWREEQISGKPCDVFEPGLPNQYGYVVIYLHGVHLQRLVDNAAFTEAFDQHGLPVVAPHTGRSWWTDRICPEFDPQLTAERHVLHNVLPYIRRRWNSGPPRMGLLGTSMGGQGALRLAYRHAAIFPVVAAISPAIDFQRRYDEDPMLQQMYADAEAARQDTAILHLHPLNWPRQQFFCCDPDDHRWWESADRLRMKLSALGIPHQAELETTCGGHGFPYYNHMAARAIAFLAESLDKERRRLA
jgi:S-formylglutathione hydrolase FrmB